MRYLIAFLTLLSTATFAQDSTGYLEGNNVRALLSNRGVFFNDNSLGRPAYEFPKNSENHLVYANAFWFGAQTELGDLKIAAETYGVAGRDIYPGAITADGLAEAPETPYADDVYIISREEILFHSTNYTVWDYVAPDAITNWPAHGDVSMGLAENLAPFADLNGNGIYEPALGEYPEIRGDHAAYIILNDKGGLHTQTGGDPLGIEMHFMFYQYESADYLNNTTFVNLRVINRSSTNYPEFVVGNYMDADIGFAGDDQAGVSEDHSLVYAYNGDLTDEGTGPSPGYGENPPAIGIVGLNHVPAVYCLTDIEGMGDPVTPVDYWEALTGTGTCEVGDDPPGDRRMFMAAPSVSLNAGEVVCRDYAIINAWGGTPLENAAALEGIADDVIDFYAAEPNIYCEFFVSLPEKEEPITFELYPNPSNGSFAVTAEGNYDLSVFAIDGRLVYTKENNTGKTEIQLNVAVGTYVLVLENDAQQMTQKLVIQ
ncbi:MAG: T9SS type A sorting domain-containing protein [Crocinitomix sp.]|nr:T9SS type A sorting domain-containing protein [Crocinitomix sp.]